MTAGLRRFRSPPQRSRAGEHCELCGETLGAHHSHVVNTETRGLLCACRACYLLFTQPGAGGGRHVAVPERYRHLASFPAGELLWESADIPVRMAFFFVNSVQQRTVGFYPSPAGATESLLPMDAWSDLTGEAPWLADLAADTEALLVHRTGDGFECFLVPIDACYELVGLVRLHWKGFDGGTVAWREIDGYFDELRRRSSTIGGGQDG